MFTSITALNEIYDLNNSFVIKSQLIVRQCFQSQGHKKTMLCGEQHIPKRPMNTWCVVIFKIFQSIISQEHQQMNMVMHAVHCTIQTFHIHIYIYIFNVSNLSQVKLFASFDSFGLGEFYFEPPESHSSIDNTLLFNNWIWKWYSRWNIHKANSFIVEQSTQNANMLNVQF